MLTSTEFWETLEEWDDLIEGEKRDAYTEAIKQLNAWKVLHDAATRGSNAMYSYASGKQLKEIQAAKEVLGIE